MDLLDFSLWCSLNIGIMALGQTATKISEKRGTFDGTGHLVTGGNLSSSKYVKGTSIEGSYALVPTRPLKLGHERQLLMDGYVVEDTAGCRRVVHQPTRHPSNPLIPGKAFLDYEDTEGVGTPSVIYDSEQKLFRMWANSWRSYRDADHHYGLYYESKDGISWRSPELRLHQIEGVESPNVFFNQPGRSTSIAVTKLPPNGGIRAVSS